MPPHDPSPGSLESPGADDDLPPAARAIIRRLCLQPIPHEGPWFVETYRSTDTVEGGLAARYDTPHCAGTAIYFLLTPGNFSAMHALKTDEVWHHYAGAPVELLLLHPDGSGNVVRMGPDILNGDRPQCVVHAGTWQGALVPGDGSDAWALLGSTMAPGFEFADYTPGDRAALAAAYPEHAARIATLTRSEASPTPSAASHGIRVEELVGRAAPQPSERISIARFVLPSGIALPTSWLKAGEEALIITRGTGTVTVSGKVTTIGPGSVVHIRPGERHHIAAGAEGDLHFHAICSPAFDPSDYVEDSPGSR